MTPQEAFALLLENKEPRPCQMSRESINAAARWWRAHGRIDGRPMTIEEGRALEHWLRTHEDEATMQREEALRVLRDLVARAGGK